MHEKRAAADPRSPAGLGVGLFLGLPADPARADRKALLRPQFKVLDMDAIRRYLAGVEALAREARLSPDPRVVLSALQVLRLISPTH